MPTPKLSYVIASRNDNFCGDPMGRLRITLWEIHQAMENFPDYEVIVVDWGSNQPISEVIDVHYKRVRFIYIPPDITAKFDSPFVETVALNAGIRRAKGEWIARLDQDIMVGERFAEWFNHQWSGKPEGVKSEIYEHPQPWPAFFSLRRELPKGVATCDSSAPVWNNLDPDCPGYFAGAVGILLAPKHLWHRTRGYDEAMIRRNHMEHDLCCRFAKLAGLVNLGKLLDCPFWHQWHDRAEADSRQSNVTGIVNYAAAVELEYLNGPNWGLGNVELSEVVI